jgi:hypothetical protein
VLFPFFSKEKATKKPIVSFDRVYQRTSKALCVSYTSVHRIMNDKRPCKSNRPKERAKILDYFDHCVTKRTIHGLYSRKIAPTVSIIHKEIKDSIKISKSKLTLYLHAKQSNVCLCPMIFLGHQTHHSEATYNLCSDFG